MSRLLAWLHDFLWGEAEETEGMMSEKRTMFQRCLTTVLGHEGGYSDHAADRGGKTRYGITEARARSYGYTGDMRELPLPLAEAIYKQNYWDALRLDDCPDEDVALELLDTAVNCGPGIAARFLQEGLNVLNNQGRRWDDLKEDGKLGTKTMTAVSAAVRRSATKSCLLKLLNAKQAVRYEAIARGDPTQEAFMIGWLDKRVSLPPAGGERR